MGEQMGNGCGWAGIYEFRMSLALHPLTHIMLVCPNYCAHSSRS